MLDASDNVADRHRRVCMTFGDEVRADDEEELPSWAGERMQAR